MTIAGPIVSFKNVTKGFSMPFGDIEVLRDVNLDIFDGEFVAITGPSGSGKSTFLNLAALLDKPTSGKVEFMGRDSAGLSDEGLAELRGSAVSMVFQNYNLLSGRSVLDNVLFRFRYQRCDPARAEREAERAIARLKLDAIARKSVKLLSGGEMQRVAIARAVANSPPLLVADEPTGNLDSTAAGLVMESFAELNQSGITILLVTHNEGLLDYCSRHISCRDGNLRDAAG